MPWFPLIYSLERLTLVAESQSQSADLSWQILLKKTCIVYNQRLRFLASDYDSIHLEDIKHVWYFKLILEHTLFSVVTCLLGARFYARLLWSE